MLEMSRFITRNLDASFVASSKSVWTTSARVVQATITCVIIAATSLSYRSPAKNSFC